MHRRHLAFSRPGRTHAYALVGALYARTCVACAGSRQCGVGGGYMRHIPRSTRRMGDPGEGTRRLHARVGRAHTPARDLAPRGGDYASEDPLSLTSIAACTPTAGRWHAANQREAGQGPGALSELPVGPGALSELPVPLDLTWPHPEQGWIFSGVGRAVDTVSVDFCTVNSARRPISAARTSSLLLFVVLNGLPLRRFAPRRRREGNPRWWHGRPLCCASVGRFTACCSQPFSRSNRSTVSL